VSEGYEEALYERLRTFQADDPSIRVEYRLREGDPAAEVLSEAAATGCDLIALGTHGRTGLDRLLMGKRGRGRPPPRPLLGAGRQGPRVSTDGSPFTPSGTINMTNRRP